MQKFIFNGYEYERMTSTMAIIVQTGIEFCLVTSTDEAW